MAAGSCVVVWCHLSRNQWVPFDPSVSNPIEVANTNPGPNNHIAIVDIGHLSSEFASCKVDLQRHVLEIPHEGTEHPVQRHICHPDSLFANKAVWEYEGDKGDKPWSLYDIETAQMIEDAVTYKGKGTTKKKGCSVLDMNAKMGLPYEINIKKKLQINVNTKKQRKIRRTVLTQDYLSEAAGLASSASDASTTRKRKNATCSTKSAANIKGADSRSDQPKGKRGASARLVSLPKETRINLGMFEGSNSDNADEFLMKYTQLVTKGRSKAADYDDDVIVMNYGDDDDHDVIVMDYGDDDVVVVEDDDDDEKAEDNEDTNKSDDVVCDKKEEEGCGVDVGGGDDDDDEAECPICFDALSCPSGYGEEGQADSCHVIELVYCRHTFHKLCVVQMYKSCGKDGFLECPSCKRVHGEKVGNCPAGWMTWNYRKGLKLPGHKGCGTLEVSYHIPRGIQAKGHPNPGKSFNARGFPRTGYIPDTDKGRTVLKLLMVAFRRRLMFTVGTSTTTGENDTVTWNDIHHKTEADSNYSGHGYPDPNYLDNVLMELAAQGVAQDCLEEDHH